MKAIYVDDENYMLIRFQMECERIPEVYLAGCFDDPLEALRYAMDNSIDAAFLDVSMPKMTGFELADRLRELYPGIVIIYISAYEEHMVKAFRESHADYYLLKPYSSADIKGVLKRAQLLSVRQRKTIVIETFGRFSVYIDGKHINFTSKRAKEILAVLVDHRGTSVSTRRLWNIMWEYEEYDHARAANLRRAILRLREILADAGVEDLVISTNGEYRLNTDIADCDYYRFLNEDPKAIQDFHGDYMVDYSWAEETTGMLIRMYPPDHRCNMREQE